MLFSICWNPISKAYISAVKIEALSGSLRVKASSPSTAAEAALLPLREPYAVCQVISRKMFYTFFIHLDGYMNGKSIRHLNEIVYLHYNPRNGMAIEFVHWTPGTHEMFIVLNVDIPGMSSRPTQASWYWTSPTQPSLLQVIMATASIHGRCRKWIHLCHSTPGNTTNRHLAFLIRQGIPGETNGLGGTVCWNIPTCHILICRILYLL